MESQSPRRKSDRSTDIGLRLTGFALLALSWLAIDALMRLRAHAVGAAPDMPAYGCAVLGVVAGGLGAVLLALGGHIFDEVEISPRWARHSPSDPSHYRPTISAPTHAQR